MKLRFELPSTCEPVVLLYLALLALVGHWGNRVGNWECIAAWSGPLQKCTEYWPEEQVMYDGVEITVQKVIHTEDYRLRLISLRVRPGTGLGRTGPDWEDGGQDHDREPPQITGSVAEIQASVTLRMY